MQLGIRLHDVKNLPLEERVAHVHELGFPCGHLAPGKFISEFSTDDAALTPGLAMYLKNLFAKNQVDIAVLGCYLNLGNPNPEQLRKITNRYMAHIRFASWLGSGVVGTETGAPNEAGSYVPESHSEAALKLYADHLRPVVKYAEQMGVVVAIEPVWLNIVSTPKRARQLLDMIGSPNLQIILDPVNLLDICNYKSQVEIVEEAVDVLGDDIAVVHIKDFVVEGNIVRSVGAGLGEMDYRPLLKFMKEKKPFIHATLENTTPENSVWCKEHILKLYEEV